MSKSIFGWDLPPGAAGDPNAPWNQQEGPCDMCGLNVDNCICPECPVCGGVGDPVCYIPDPAWSAIHKIINDGKPDHGLVRSFAQVAFRADLDRRIDEEVDRE